MSIRVNKPSFNLREKLSELTSKFGLKGTELARAETVQDARDLISAGRKNVIINGDMRIAQRATSANVPNSGAIGTLDRWYSWINYTTGAVVMSQETDAPAGFQNSLKVIRNDSSSTAQYFFLGQKIEAQNLSQLAVGTSSAKPFTISFWVKSNRPGTYNLEALDDDGSHQLVKQYKINNSGVWEYKSITFPPNTVGGVPTYDNSVGLDLAWWLSSNANTTYTSGSLTDTWAAYATNRRNAGGNPILDTGEYWMISGVQLEVGKNATDFEHRSYGEELALCQRYYHRDPTNWYQSAIIDGNGTLIGTFIRHPVPMRATPSVNHLVISAYYWNINGTGNSSVTPNGTTSYYGGNQTFGMANLSGCTNLGGTNNDQIPGQFKTQIEYSAEL